MGLSGLDKVKGLVIGKHGLISWGETAKECYGNLHRLITKAEEYLKPKRAAKEPLAKRRHPATDVVRGLDFEMRVELASALVGPS